MSEYVVVQKGLRLGKMSNAVVSQKLSYSQAKEFCESSQALYPNMKFSVKKVKASKVDFKPCPNRYWHHLGTTCSVCGQKG